MYIRTITGWKALPVRNCQPAVTNTERYVGPIPSFDCLSYISRCEKAHDEWISRSHGHTED